MRIIAEPGVHTTVLDDGSLLVVSRTGKVFRANPTAAAMWTAIVESDGGFDQVADVIANRYGIPGERARSDLATLAGTLHDVQLIRWQS